MKRVRVNISTVSCSYNEWFRRRAKDLLFLATFESVMKKDDAGTVFCIMHKLEPAPNGIVRLSTVAKLCTNHLVISRHLRRHSGGDLDQRLWPLLSFLMAAVFHPRFCGHCFWQILREEWIARSDCNGIVTGCLLFWRRFKLYFCGKRPKLAQRLTLGKRPVTERMKINPDVL